MKVGLIGPGVMGKSMLINIAKANHQVSFYARSKNKVQDLINDGYKSHDSIRDLVLSNDIIITIVGMPNDVEEVYFGHDMIIDNLDSSKIIIDMTTSSPSLALRISEAAKQKGAESLDCPVTGGDIGAKNGTLTIFCGGERAAFDTIRSLLSCIGTTIYYAGGHSMGQHAKLANQIGIAGAISAMAEMICYGQSVGLNIDELIPVFASGSAGSWQLKNMGPRALAGDFAPGFFIKHFIKDMNLIEEEAKKQNLSLQMLETVLTMFKKLQEEGYDDKGTQSIIDYYRR